MSRNKENAKEPDVTAVIVRIDDETALMVEMARREWLTIEEIASGMKAIFNKGLSTGHLTIFTGKGCILKSDAAREDGQAEAIEDVERVKRLRKEEKEGFEAEEIGIRIEPNGAGFRLMALQYEDGSYDGNDMLSKEFSFSILKAME
jgi:hypothetical protein